MLKYSFLVPALCGTLTNAFTPAFQRVDFRVGELAMQGYNADGSPMQLEELFNVASSRTKDAPKIPALPIPEERVDLPLDHFGNDDRTYENQFWVSDVNYKEGGPVFIYDGGEGDAAGRVDFRLGNETSFFKQLVDEFNGIGIVWQHRYYGDSAPFNISTETPTENFQWLTTDQALADVPYFAKNFSRQGIDYDLTPAGTPWVFVGGSYPGMRAAFSRAKYPETFIAGYASSAPVEARNDMSIYFDPIPKAMKNWGWGNCSSDITAAVKRIDHILEDKSAAADLKIKFLGRAADKLGNAYLADALTTIFYLWQSYGVDGGDYGLRAFCDYLETDPKSGKTAPAEGWAASRGASYTVDRWTEYPLFAEMVNSYYDSDCEGNNKTSDAIPACDLAAPFSAPDTISWTYQYCTEWGFLQSSNLGKDQLVSKFNSLSHQRDICHNQFTDASASKYVPYWPTDRKTNRNFGGWQQLPSNVYWSGGQYDPWRTLSPLSDEPFAPNFKLTQTAPKCNQKAKRGEIFGYVMEDACHCFDFRTYFPGGTASRQNFSKALKSWLPCFEGSKA